MNVLRKIIRHSGTRVGVALHLGLLLFVVAGLLLSLPLERAAAAGTATEDEQQLPVASPPETSPVTMRDVVFSLPSWHPLSFATTMMSDTP